MPRDPQEIENLHRRHQAITAKINAFQARIKENDRRDETRIKVLIGAALLNDTLLHPETRAGLVAVINRAITTEKDREFLKMKGWL